MQLTNKVALVTGAAAGIGFALAKRLAAEGARVVIADIDEAGCRSAAEVIASEGHGDALGICTDITDENAVEAAMAETASRFGALDILVSNAGNQIISPLERLSYADWRKIMSVHLDGAFLVTRAALRQMYASGRGGSIVYIGSVHSRLASVLKAPYVTAKHGVLGLCRAVAKEGAARGVRANVVCPGFVRTKLVEAQIPEQARVLGISEDDVVQKVMLKDTLDGQFTTTDEVADAVVFFASSASLAMTGQSLNVTHGWHMG